jgi:hypothetical protein
MKELLMLLILVIAIAVSAYSWGYKRGKENAPYFKEISWTSIHANEDLKPSEFWIKFKGKNGQLINEIRFELPPNTVITEVEVADDLFLRTRFFESSKMINEFHYPKLEENTEFKADEEEY